MWWAWKALPWPWPDLSIYTTWIQPMPNLTNATGQCACTPIIFIFICSTYSFHSCCNDGVCTDLGNKSYDQKCPISEHRSTFMLCVEVLCVYWQIHMTSVPQQSQTQPSSPPCLLCHTPCLLPSSLHPLSCQLSCISFSLPNPAESCLKSHKANTIRSPKPPAQCLRTALRTANWVQALLVQLLANQTLVQHHCLVRYDLVDRTSTLLCTFYCLVFPYQKPSLTFSSILACSLSSPLSYSTLRPLSCP